MKDSNEDETYGLWNQSDNKPLKIFVKAIKALSTQKIAEVKYSISIQM